jgi:hypothetical protein
MRRLSLFLGSMSFGQKLQLLIIVVLLANHAWFDFQIGKSEWTIGIIFAAFAFGWMLKPVMVMYPRMTYRIWGAFGILILAAYVFGNHIPLWRTLLGHFLRELLLWLDISCGYWFISEMRLRQLELHSQVLTSDPFDSNEETDEAADPHYDQSANTR